MEEKKKEEEILLGDGLEIWSSLSLMEEVQVQVHKRRRW